MRHALLRLMPSAPWRAALETAASRGRTFSANPSAVNHAGFCGTSHDRRAASCRFAAELYICWLKLGRFSTRCAQIHPHSLSFSAIGGAFALELRKMGKACDSDE